MYLFLELNWFKKCISLRELMRLTMITLACVSDQSCSDVPDTKHWVECPTVSQASIETSQTLLMRGTWKYVIIDIRDEQPGSA